MRKFLQPLLVVSILSVGTAAQAGCGGGAGFGFGRGPLARLFRPRVATVHYHTVDYGYSSVGYTGGYNPVYPNSYNPVGSYNPVYPPYAMPSYAPAATVYPSQQSNMNFAPAR
jgi:hypothetical protein